MTDSYHWRNQEGAEVASGFPSQAEAEAWFSESWQDLTDVGTTAVSLYEADRLIYGPMSLEADS